MRKTIRFLSLLALLTAATGAWAQRLYFEVSGTTATLKYSINPADYDGKASFDTTNNSWTVGSGYNTISKVKGEVTTIIADASCVNFTGNNLSGLITYCQQLTSVNLSGLNTANVTDMSRMFHNCQQLTSVNLSGLNTAKVIDMSYMFISCSSLTTVNLSDWNTAKVFNMSGMFQGCSSLTTLDLSDWNTANVTDMSSMFLNCSSMTTLNLSNWNTANVTNMSRMFQDCSSMTTLDLSDWNTAKVFNMSGMFQGCSSLMFIYVGDGWSAGDHVNVSTSMFEGCKKLPNYKSSVVDKTNAHTGEGGYLSVKSSGGGTDPAADSYTISLNDGEENPTTWTAKVGDATDFSPLPIEGVAEGESVTLKYSGTRKVKSITVNTDAVDLKATPLTIEAITNGAIVVNSPKDGMKFSKDGGQTKMTVVSNINVAAGDKVSFYGSATSYHGTFIVGSGDGFTCKVYGNIMSLVDETDFANVTTLPANSTFRQLFMANTCLTDASGLLLPATELTEACYYSMFQSCTSLTAAPALEATKMAKECYASMFNGCENLTTAPEKLPAEKMENYCYQNMFRGCAKLATAPELPAETLAIYCYQNMFYGCTSLTTAPQQLPATTLANYCYNQMFYNCTSLTTAPVLPATTLAANCYTSMFQKCSSLNAVTCLAPSIVINTHSKNWLSGVASTGTFTKLSTATWATNNVSSIPSGWTVVNYVAPNN